MFKTSKNTAGQYPLPREGRHRDPVTFRNPLGRGRKNKKWSGRKDLNLRPHRPERCALPGCATPRNLICLSFPALTSRQTQKTSLLSLQPTTKMTDDRKDLDNIAISGCKIKPLRPLDHNQPGPVIFSGRTQASNSSSVTNPRRIADSFRVDPLTNASCATFADRSYPICGESAVTSIREFSR